MRRGVWLATACAPVLAYICSQNFRNFVGYWRWRYNLQMWAVPRITAGVSDVRHHVLILGSSVSAGDGAESPAPGGLSWAQRLAQALEPHRMQLHNRGIQATETGLWQWILAEKVSAECLAEFSIVVMSLSLGNEGLPFSTDPDHVAFVENKYRTGLRGIARALRAKMRPGARLILGGPYPNDLYQDVHVPVLHRVLEDMKTWEEVDHVVDFLKPGLHDGGGKFAPGTSRDYAHPNKAGHEQMFNCLDLATILGPLASA
mmetsp:Transcript_46541/g.120445  ORF Transcript_46541/g.120445 Transcript_46541/m.120445 type:complete len:259 (+) Transcript_46541:2-778(+)